MDGSTQPWLQITMLANIIAAALAKNLTPSEINVLGNLITLIGTALTTIAAIEQDTNSSGTDNVNTTISSNQPISEEYDNDKCNDLKKPLI